MNILFRRVTNPKDFKKTIAFLKEDVERSGGTAGEIINVHGSLVHIEVSRVPWGTLVIKKEVTRLEAIAWFTSGEDAEEEEAA